MLRSMPKLSIPTFSLALLLAATPSALAESEQTTGLQVTIVNMVTPSQVCTQETNTLTVFKTATEQIQLKYKEMSDPFASPVLFGQYEFGVQENSWFWIPKADPGHQDPDNAGMQVILSDTCEVSTAASLLPGGPDTRQVITVTGKQTAPGQCQVTVTRKSPPGLYPTKDCCAPDLPQFKVNCKTLGIQRGETASKP